MCCYVILKTLVAAFLIALLLGLAGLSAGTCAGIIPLLLIPLVLFWFLV